MIGANTPGSEISEEEMPNSEEDSESIERRRTEGLKNLVFLADDHKKLKKLCLKQKTEIENLRKEFE